ncbi:hypothetical protein DFH94DRAFT_848674 [Russula ochroleuca]|uniref:Uncharacterized protein n=1 Tax=Russula ochroleuca TaxID=152965 RepID=A0A9P5JVF2_9AGAM|nr:hypothetical protein DFH94DRAFT_848674 [Russula ochroleuca]
MRRVGGEGWEGGNNGFDVAKRFLRWEALKAIRLFPFRTGRLGHGMSEVAIGGKGRARAAGTELETLQGYYLSSRNTRGANEAFAGRPFAGPRGRPAPRASLRHIGVEGAKRVVQVARENDMVERFMLPLLFLGSYSFRLTRPCAPMLRGASMAHISGGVLYTAVMDFNTKSAETKRQEKNKRGQTYRQVVIPELRRIAFLLQLHPGGQVTIFSEHALKRMISNSMRHMAATAGPLERAAVALDGEPSSWLDHLDGGLVQREDAEKIVVGGSKTIRKMITQAVGNELQGREEAPRVLDSGLLLALFGARCTQSRCGGLGVLASSRDVHSPPSHRVPYGAYGSKPASDVQRLFVQSYLRFGSWDAESPSGP